ncbi:HDOD domain-containing protein [Pleionea litopenaei]|uniref:HDOD domain-containing protein n=1 Tax=Pleionea litopenaei TaxID=3070815 RepID=A0AA51RVY6_9GAMM|nr:HDOD domain-containing protein [Pleionea sp. HL-JVS1]WMS88651.1 HDOD domain-containing protein [Pleionea sp. HL-JVS1]
MLNLEDIPLPSENHMALIKLCTSSDIDVDRFAAAIEANAIISSRLLAMVNSAYYNFSQPIATIHHAVVALGLTTVQNIVLCFAIKDSLQDESQLSIDTYPFWRDALFRAVAAKLWMQTLSSKDVSRDDASTAFTCGLLADIGLLALFLMAPDKQERWLPLIANTPDNRLKLERDIFATDHVAIGTLLLERWHLPANFSQAIAYHHDAKPDAQLSTYLALADWTVALLHSCDKALALKNIYSMQNTIDEDSMDDFFNKLSEQVVSISETLDLGKMSSLDFNQLYQQANIKLAQDNLSYQELTWKLQEALKERDRLALKLDQELEVAREIQKSMQSDTSYRQRVAAINIPAKKLSGDFFDYYDHHNGSITFCLGDVSGKGTHAALVMAKTISLYRCLSKVEPNIQRVVDLMNDEIYETSIRGMFVTFIAGRLDTKTQTLELVNAGHIPALKVGENSIEQIEAHGPPLGVVDGYHFDVYRNDFKQRRLYLYTDGITESRKKDGTELGTKEFIQWIVQSRHLPLHEQLDFLQSRFENDIEEWQDDLTLMMLASCD